MAPAASSDGSVTLYPLPGGVGEGELERIEVVHRLDGLWQVRVTGFEAKDEDQALHLASVVLNYAAEDLAEELSESWYADGDVLP